MSRTLTAFEFISANEDRLVGEQFEQIIMLGFKPVTKDCKPATLIAMGCLEKEVIPLVMLLEIEAMLSQINPKDIRRIDMFKSMLQELSTALNQSVKRLVA